MKHPQFESILEQEIDKTIDNVFYANSDFTSHFLVRITIKKMRVSSTFRIVKKSGLNPYYNILINENLFTLNTIKDIKAVFRHILIHVCQLNIGKRQAHTKEFYRLSDLLKAEDPKILKRPPSNYKTFYFICPDGCQQFSSTDEPKVNCFYCGKEMKKYNSEQYRKYKKILREKI